MDDILRDANEGMDTLYAFWMDYYGEHALPLR